MRVLIVENEIYLAQSINSKLSEHGFECEVCATLNETLQKDTLMDVVLLSTNVSGQNFYPVINKFKNSIIILMIAYISNDTVASPLKAGAKDYILKPFMISELIRKIEHYLEFEKLKSNMHLYRSSLDVMLSVAEIQDVDINRISYPIFLQSSSNMYAFKFLMSLLENRDENIKLVSLQDENIQANSYDTRSECIYYYLGYESLRKSQRADFEKSVASKKAIIYISEHIENLSFRVLQLKGKSGIDIHQEVISIDDYIKLIITQYEKKYPDTELSRKLGISRKSLWEKRKKYGLIKKK